MITVVRVVRVLVLLLLAFIAISLVKDVATSETGVIEKSILVVALAACVFAAAKVSTLATRTEARLQRP